MSRVSLYALCLSLLLAAWGRSGSILARSWSSWRDRKSFAGRLLEHYTSLHCTKCKKYFRSSLQAAVLLLTCKESAIWPSLLESPCRSLPAGMVTHASTLTGMQQGRPESHVSSKYLHLAFLDTVITVNEWWHPVKLSSSSFLNIFSTKRRKLSYIVFTRPLHLARTLLNIHESRNCARRRRHEAAAFHWYDTYAAAIMEMDRLHC